MDEIGKQFYESCKMMFRPCIAENFKGRNRDVLVPAILDVFHDLADYLPLTVRQVYYQLVPHVVANQLREYQNISRILTRMRELELVPWSYVTDRSRRMVDKKGVEDLEVHLREYVPSVFDYYNRCLVQNQENYVEVWTEKDALSSIFEEAVWRYCCRIVVCRGQVSATFLNEYSNRAKQAMKRGQRPVILYFGDLDPTGLKIPEVITEKLFERYDIEIHLVRAGLTVEHIKKHNLPHNPEAVKQTDTNFNWYVKKGFGEYGVELDALHPKDLIELIDSSVRKQLDIEDMIEQQNIQEQERLILKRLKLGFIDLCHQEGITI